MRRGIALGIIVFLAVGAVGCGKKTEPEITEVVQQMPITGRALYMSRKIGIFPCNFRITGTIRYSRKKHWRRKTDDTPVQYVFGRKIIRRRFLYLDIRPNLECAERVLQ